MAHYIEGSVLNTLHGRTLPKRRVLKKRALLLVRRSWSRLFRVLLLTRATGEIFIVKPIKLCRKSLDVWVLVIKAGIY